MQIALTLKPDERANSHGVPGHSHIVRDARTEGLPALASMAVSAKRAFLFISGGGFAPGVHERRSSLIDIAPTVLRPPDRRRYGWPALPFRDRDP